MDKDRLNILKDTIATLKGSVTKAEFQKAFRLVLDAVLKKERLLDEKNEKSLRNLLLQFKELSDTLKKDTSDSFSTVKDTLIKDIGQAIKDVKASLKVIEDKASRIKEGTDGEPGKDGHTPTDQELLSLIKPLVPVLKEFTPEELRDKLEKLEGKERLNKKSVDGIEEIEEDIKQIKLRPVRGGGAKGFMLFTDGTKRLLTAQSLNIVAGSNITLSYAYANGRNDVTISGSAGGSLSVLTATGAVSDANVTFTFASEPTLVIVNGAAYRHGAGVTISGTTVTLDNPVGNGGDIYALG